jgi:hypothetical protein
MVSADVMAGIMDLQAGDDKQYSGERGFSGKNRLSCAKLDADYSHSQIISA